MRRCWPRSARRTARAVASSAGPPALPRLEGTGCRSPTETSTPDRTGAPAADTGAALLWRCTKSDLLLPVLELLSDGSCRSVLAGPEVKGTAWRQLVEAAWTGQALEADKGRHVRVIGYEIPDREGRTS